MATKKPPTPTTADATPKAIAITPELVAEHGFKGDEYERVLDILGREPSIVELGIFSVMWSEHFWITPFHREGDAFAGTIGNTPMLVSNVTEGQEYRFPRADISDWGYMQDGKLHGYFTLRALLPYMAEAEAAQYRALLADE